MIAGSIYALLARLLEIQIDEKPNRDFWEKKFVEEAERKLLLDERADCLFDQLFIDESQDLLCRPRLLNCVEFLLHGGFQNGRWALFGDFKNQIFADDGQRENVVARLLELKAIERTASYDLDENCRNYAIVGKTGLCLAGMGEVYSEYRRGDGSQESYSPLFYTDQSSFQAKLKAEIKRYVDSGTPLAEIVVLSCTGVERSIATGLVGNGNLLKLYGSDGDQASFASVYEYKVLKVA